MKKELLSILAVAVLTQGIAFAHNTPYLDRVNSPADVKNMTIGQMKGLANDIRWGILNHSNLVGGHLAPDLGIVEATIALHYVFNSPEDKIVFDVSHQSYPHKMITGRKAAFTDPLNNRNITGYSNPAESEHDFFILGHTSTSLSLAGGMAKARDLKGESGNVIAVIGDGSLSGGEALEGLSTGATLGSNFIIVLNDNDMCIAPTNGGLYKGLADLRSTRGKSVNNIFKAMGYDYYYVENGNNIKSLIEAFEKVKDTQKPTVVHIHTLKGKGYKPAELDPETYHAISAGALDKKKNTQPEVKTETYASLTADYLLNKKATDNRIIAISPATPGVSGFTPEFRQKMGKNYMDVDIAEQNSIGYISGIATNGGKPVLGIMSSFIQRAYDQLSQDFAINNAPATILVFWGGISGTDVTHLNIFDIPLISNIPNIVYLSPTTKEEYLAMLDWSVEQDKYPVAIRVPSGDVVSTGQQDNTDYSDLNKFKVAHRGQKVAIIAAGNFFKLGEETQKEIKDKLGIDATLINPVYLTGVDTALLEDLKKNHDIVITLEDGCLDGGFGEKITRFYSTSDMKVLNYGAKKEFTDRVPLDELYQRYRLKKELIVEDIKKLL